MREGKEAGTGERQRLKRVDISEKKNEARG